MPLKLMYITNNPVVATIAQDSGIDRLFVDMEYIGKDERQAGMDTVKSHHTIADVEAIHDVTDQGSSELLVRVNPLHGASKGHSSSREEIDDAIACGADILMLPMWRTRNDVDEFLSYVGNRAKTILLLETKEAVECVNEIASVGGFDELHIGLNDLHLAYGMRFMFEPLADGMIDQLAQVLRSNETHFGFGGIARVGRGLLPSEYVIREHYRLGSEMAILSRSFCNAAKITDVNKLRDLFFEGVANIRTCELQAAMMSQEKLAANHREVVRLVGGIAERSD